MKTSRAAILLIFGGLIGWVLRPAFEEVPSVPWPTVGGTVCRFKAEVTWHPETRQEATNGTMHETTWRWVFHNASDKPIQLSIPQQHLHLERSTTSSQYLELPEALIVDPPITLAPDEQREFTTGCWGMSWHKAKDKEYGFQVVAKIDDGFHILSCAATVREGSKEAQGQSPSRQTITF